MVGDSKGAVTVYRVLSPPLITHLGPRQQTERLKAAVVASCDPVALQKLKEFESKGADKTAAPAPTGEEGDGEGADPVVQQ